MRRSLALLIPVLALAAACSQSPTAATKRPAARFDGGNTLGSGNVVDPGGNTMGSGNAAGSEGTAGGSTASDQDGGIFFGGGHVVDNESTTTTADSVITSDRGINTMGSGN
ncbi:MAG TPA: hypothetical protein VFJ16_20795 [Longimicrobium sp.]|nr:hypothetical protein [Longimicrobium sp.]